LDPIQTWGSLGENNKKRLGCWLANQHGAQWPGLGDTQRQVREFISGPSLGTRAKFMTFNTIQSRVVTGLLMGHNTLRTSLPTSCLTASYVGSAGWERKPRLTFYVSARLWPHSNMRTRAPFSWSRRILGVRVGAIWNYSKFAGLP